MSQGKKILLISPPIFDFYYTPGRKEPLGLLYIKTALDKINGVLADIYDCTLSGKVKKITTPDCYHYLQEIYREDVSQFAAPDAGPGIDRDRSGIASEHSIAHDAS